MTELVDEAGVLKLEGVPIAGAQVTVGVLGGTKFETLEAGSALLDAGAKNLAKTKGRLRKNG